MPLLSRLKPLALPVASGILLALAFPPFGLMLLAYVALVPILLAVRGLRFWQAFRKGYVFAIIFALPNMFWLEQFVARWTGSVLFGMVPWLIVSFAFAVYFALFCGAAAKCWQLNWPWAIPLMLAVWKIAPASAHIAETARSISSEATSGIEMASDG